MAGGVVLKDKEDNLEVPTRGFVSPRNPATGDLKFRTPQKKFEREIQAFRGQVLDWLRARDEGQDNETKSLTTARILASQNDLAVVAISSELVRKLHQGDRFQFREEEIFQGVLDKIKLPLDPTRDLTGKCDGPVIIVAAEGNRKLFVVNGSHRTFRVADPENLKSKGALFALVLNGPTAAKLLLNVTIKPEDYTNSPPVVQGDRVYGDKELIKEAREAATIAGRRFKAEEEDLRTDNEVLREIDAEFDEACRRVGVDDADTVNKQVKRPEYGEVDDYDLEIDDPEIEKAMDDVVKDIEAELDDW